MVTVLTSTDEEFVMLIIPRKYSLSLTMMESSVFLRFFEINVPNIIVVINTRIL